MITKMKKYWKNKDSLISSPWLAEMDLILSRWFQSFFSKVLLRSFAGKMNPFWRAYNGWLLERAVTNSRNISCFWTWIPINLTCRGHPAYPNMHTWTLQKWMVKRRWVKKGKGKNFDQKMKIFPFKSYEDCFNFPSLDEIFPSLLADCWNMDPS